MQLALARNTPSEGGPVCLRASSAEMGGDGRRVPWNICVVWGVMRFGKERAFIIPCARSPPLQVSPLENIWKHVFMYLLLSPFRDVVLLTIGTLVLLRRRSVVIMLRPLRIVMK